MEDNKINVLLDKVSEYNLKCQEKKKELRSNQIKVELIVETLIDLIDTCALNQLAFKKIIDEKITTEMLLENAINILLNSHFVVNGEIINGTDMEHNEVIKILKGYQNEFN